MSTLLLDNDHASRFEWRENGGLVYADYRRGPDRIIILHTEAEPKVRGSGAAGRMMEAIAKLALERRLDLELRDAYAASWIGKHPKYADLVVGPQIPHDGTDGEAFRLGEGL